MPNFDRLARAGTHIRNSFTCQPLCVPARAAIQTGRYPSQVGAFRNDRPLPPGTRTLAHEFRAAGYRTGYIGKWHLAPREVPGAVLAANRGGYEDWLAANVLELVSDAYETRLYDERGAERRLPGYRVDALTDAAIRFVGTPREQPFFLFVSFLEPHHQNHRDDYPAPDGYAERYRGRWMPPDLARLGGSGAGAAHGRLEVHRLGPSEDAARAIGEPTWPVYTEEALYDLSSDPNEFVNVSDLPRYAPVAATLRERLLRRMAEAGQRDARIEPSPARQRATVV